MATRKNRPKPTPGTPPVLGIMHIHRKGVYLPANRPGTVTKVTIHADRAPKYQMRVDDGSVINGIPWVAIHFLEDGGDYRVAKSLGEEAPKGFPAIPARVVVKEKTTPASA